MHNRAPASSQQNEKTQGFSTTSPKRAHKNTRKHKVLALRGFSGTHHEPESLPSPGQLLKTHENTRFLMGSLWNTRENTSFERDGRVPSSSQRPQTRENTRSLSDQVSTTRENLWFDHNETHNPRNASRKVRKQLLQGRSRRH